MGRRTRRRAWEAALAIAIAAMLSVPTKEMEQDERRRVIAEDSFAEVK